MINFLQQYLRIDTVSHPNAHYNEAIALFEAKAQSWGMDYQIVKLSSGFNALIVTLPGSDKTLPSLLLNHHMDVVPADDAADWLHDPFSATIADGKIYGRGTQDMKSIGVCHFFAMHKMLEHGIKPRRSIHLVMLPDEEVGGYNGAGCFVEHPLFAALNIGYSLDEGVASGRSDLLNIKVSERKPLQLLFTSKGDMAHGSRINVTNASHELVLFLSQLAQFQRAQREKIADTPTGLLLSVNVTSLKAGLCKDGIVARNVVGDTARAVVDVRVPPQMRLQEVQAWVDHLLQDFAGISYSIESTVPERLYDPNFDNDFYQVVKSSIEKKGLMVTPFHAEESSDSRFYASKGVKWLGLTPYTSKENLHGRDECVALTDLALGLDIFYDILVTFCG